MTARQDVEKNVRNFVSKIDDSIKAEAQRSPEAAQAANKAVGEAAVMLLTDVLVDLRRIADAMEKIVVNTKDIADNTQDLVTK